MKSPNLFLGAFLALSLNAVAEDKVSGDLTGSVEVEGISYAGEIVGDFVPSYQKHPLVGKVSIVTDTGRVHRVETYSEWQAVNGVRGRVWERLYVSGGTFTGWTERLIQTPKNIIFTRNVIDGDFEQKIETDGSGYVEWTVTGSDTEIDSSDSTSSDTSANPHDKDLPSVDIEDEGEFDGVSDRRIDISMHGDRPSFKFRDNGYERMSLTDEEDASELIVNQKLKMEGRGKGSLAFIPDEENSGSATSTPTPGAVPTTTSTPTTTSDSSFSDTSF